MFEKIRLTGECFLEVKNAEGKTKTRLEIRNVVTDIGRAQVAGLINGVVTSPFKYIAIGTGATGITSTSTSLSEEIARKPATVGRLTTNVANDTAYWEATFSSADGLSGTSSVAEAGIFDAETGGNMLLGKNFEAIEVNWDEGDTFTVAWKLTIGERTATLIKQPIFIRTGINI